MAKKIREFKDGTVLVETGPSKWEVLSERDFVSAQLYEIDLGVSIMTRLETIAPHCQFKIVRNEEEDMIYMNDEPLIDLMVYYGSLKVYWNIFFTDRGDHKPDAISLDEFIDTKLMPSVQITFSIAEHKKCSDNWKYFHDNYIATNDRPGSN
jgi:hypothetical protein